MKRLLKNALLADPVAGTTKKMDLLADNGSIAAIRENIQPDADCQVHDLTGKYVTAGWLDTHAHLYHEDGAIGINGSSLPAAGTTFVLDAGTAGAGNYEHFRSSLAHDGVRCRAFLNIAYMGIVPKYGELKDLDTIRPDMILEVCSRYPKEIIGLKLRIDARVCQDASRAMAIARRLGDELGLPVAVHASRCTIPTEEVLSYLVKGDIFAHCFSGTTPGILSEDGRILPCVAEAARRGVKFDVAHGKGNFSFRVARKAIEQGFFPHSISTDLHAGSVSVVGGLGDVMSKMLHCGVDLMHVLRLVGQSAVSMVGLEDCKSVRITPGKEADITVFSIEDGEWKMTDTEGTTECLRRRIVPFGSLVRENWRDGV